MGRRALATGVALSLLLVAACGEEPTSIDDFDTVITLYDRDADFGSFLTYAMPDSVVHVGTDTIKQLSRRHDEVVLNEIALQMEAAGYVRVTDPAASAPDLVVLAGVTISPHIGYATYPVDYWDWWYGWGWYAPFDASWDFYYPWYSTSVVYVYRTGTLLIDVLDPRMRDDQRKLVGALWIGVVNGVLDGNELQLDARIREGVARAFEQSPYLRTDGTDFDSTGNRQ